jgi:hypothetical protein
MNERKNSTVSSQRFSGDAGSLDGLSRLLIHRAARHAPDSLSERLEEEWLANRAAIVQVCVDTRGRLTSDPVTLQGSGSFRLDEGALKPARAGSGHYRATTEDGRPVDSCYPFRVRFQLRH